MGRPCLPKQSLQSLRQHFLMSLHLPWHQNGCVSVLDLLICFKDHDVYGSSFSYCPYWRGSYKFYLHWNRWGRLKSLYGLCSWLLNPDSHLWFSWMKYAVLSANYIVGVLVVTIIGFPWSMLFLLCLSRLCSSWRNIECIKFALHCCVLWHFLDSYLFGTWAGTWYTDPSWLKLIVLENEQLLLWLGVEFHIVI